LKCEKFTDDGRQVMAIVQLDLKRLENKFLTTLTEIQELKNQCEQKDNEINDLQKSLEDKQSN
jgi:5-carboxymethyl-2-hydroxymuconate isomerase